MDETDWMDETYQWMGGTDGTEETGRRDGTDGTVGIIPLGCYGDKRCVMLIKQLL